MHVWAWQQILLPKKLVAPHTMYQEGPDESHDHKNADI